MAYPTSPSDGDIYGTRRWNATIGAWIELSTVPQGTNDTEYVPMVLHGTDATPPAASGFPVGSMYVQYTP